jgi:hypothetical protein
MILTDNNVQGTLNAALLLLASALAVEQEKTRNEIVIMRLTIVLSSLLTLKMLSKSSNGIPGLRGLGLEEGVSLAQRIITDGVNPHLLTLSYRSLFDGIQTK